MHIDVKRTVRTATSNHETQVFAKSYTGLYPMAEAVRDYKRFSESLDHQAAACTQDGDFVRYSIELVSDPTGEVLYTILDMTYPDDPIFHRDDGSVIEPGDKALWFRCPTELPTYEIFRAQLKELYGPLTTMERAIMERRTVYIYYVYHADAEIVSERPRMRISMAFITDGEPEIRIGFDDDVAAEDECLPLPANHNEWQRYADFHASHSISDYWSGTSFIEQMHLFDELIHKNGRTREPEYSAPWDIPTDANIGRYYFIA